MEFVSSLALSLAFNEFSLFISILNFDEAIRKQAIAKIVKGIEYKQVNSGCFVRPIDTSAMNMNAKPRRVKRTVIISLLMLRVFRYFHFIKI